MVTNELQAESVLYGDQGAVSGKYCALTSTSLGRTNHLSWFL